MKITIATGPIFPVPAVLGGAVPRLWEGLAREFAKRGHEVTIFAREFPGQAKEEVVDGIRYVRHGGYEQSTSIRRDLFMCLLYALGAARHVPSGDVVVTNDFWMPAVLPWLKPSAGSVVASIARFPKKQFFLYGKCAAIAPVSESVAQGIRDQSPNISGKLIVVPNCVDESFLAPLQNKEQPSTVRMLFVGRIHPEKGLELLAEALKRMEQGAWECVLVGPVAQAEGGGGEGFADALKAWLRGLPVRFQQPVYDARTLAGIYDTGDILVYPSVAERGEAMPLAPLEAMARGLVPVVSDIAAFREYLEPGKNGMVFDHRSPAAAENLAGTLGKLIGDKACRQRLSHAARTTAERFSPAAIADKYLQLFEKVVSGK